jgi:hypothetical protein
MGGPIAWHAHGQAAYFAVLNDCEALLWGTGGDAAAWAVYLPEGQHPVQTGDAGSFDQARQQAETALREVGR